MGAGLGRSARRWGLGLGVLGLLAALNLCAWPLVWRLVLLPNASPQRLGLEVAAHEGEQGAGRAIASFLTARSSMELERPNSAATALGVWRVERAGSYDLRLECDDYGDLAIDRRLIISLHGTSAFNEGQARVFLEAGPRLVRLSLHNRQGAGWMRLLVKGPGDEEYRLLDDRELAALDLGNQRAWLMAVDLLEQGALWGLGLWPMACLLLWAWGGRRIAGQVPPRPGRARLLTLAFVAAVLLIAVVTSWHTVNSHVRWLDLASGHDYLANEEWSWHRAVVENRHADHRSYRVLPDLWLAGVEALLQGRETDPAPARLLFWCRFLIDVLAFLLAALFYRRLGLSRPATILGLGLLAWAFSPTYLRNGLNFATFLDVALFLAAGVMTLERRLASVVVLSALAALNKETSILIPLLPLAASVGWRPKLEIPRPELKAAALGLGAWLLVYGGMHLVLGVGFFHQAHDRPAMEFFRANLQDPEAWSQLYKTLGVLPFLALFGLWRSPLILRRFFLAVVPVWFLVHAFIALWAETRLFLVPMALVFVPGSLFALKREGGLWGVGGV